jgi:hypothetical protein
MIGTDSNYELLVSIRKDREFAGQPSNGKFLGSIRAHRKLKAQLTNRKPLTMLDDVAVTCYGM